jgi:hypothetical protein
VNNGELRERLTRWPDISSHHAQSLLQLSLDMSQMAAPPHTIPAGQFDSMLDVERTT